MVGACLIYVFRHEIEFGFGLAAPPAYCIPPKSGIYRVVECPIENTWRPAPPASLSSLPAPSSRPFAMTSLLARGQLERSGVLCVPHGPSTAEFQFPVPPSGVVRKTGHRCSPLLLKAALHLQRRMATL
ncbi:hypothetical protein AcV5_007221 [Taiwanofungus camphoratus]|nr:hypothetical protein AcV5_007221 [Antrodia cinnamomea]